MAPDLPGQGELGVPEPGLWPTLGSDLGQGWAFKGRNPLTQPVSGGLLVDLS